MSGYLVENSYGKSRVRLTKIVRHADRHDLMEMSVDIQLQGEFDLSYTDGDNKQIVATDTMKNTVYALAAKHSFEDIETFGKLLAEHFLSRNTHVHAVSVTIEQDRWDRIETQGKPHQHSFVGGNKEKRVAHVDACRGSICLEGGIENLMVLKTTDSEFWGFIRDEYTTLPEVRDRIFATSVMAHWSYKSENADFNGTHAKVRQLILDVFAAHKSKAVQETLYAICRKVLEECADVEEIRIEMPNQHRILFDLSKFDMKNNNEIFVPTDEPFGLISATVARNPRQAPKSAAAVGAASQS